MGGEEFVVILEGLAVPAAEAVIQKALDALAARTFRVRESDEALGTITFSAGVVPFGADGSSALKHADELLYAAKAQGRNMVISANATAMAT